MDFVEGRRSSLGDTMYATLWTQRFNIAGSICALVTVFVAFEDRGNGWPVALLSLAFLALGNIGKFAGSKVSLSGSESAPAAPAQAPAVVETANRINDLKELAFLFGTSIINNITITGRRDGLFDKQEEEMISRIIKYFDDIGISEDIKKEALKLRYRSIEHEYRLLCTGGNSVPEDLPKKMTEEWESLRADGLERIVRPNEIGAFLQSAKMFNTERAQLLEDYHYYLQHRQHRRPDVWANRRHLST